MTQTLAQRVEALSDIERHKLLIYMAGGERDALGRALMEMGWLSGTGAPLPPKADPPPATPGAHRVEDLAAGSLFAPQRPAAPAAQPDMLPAPAPAAKDAADFEGAR